ncbi:hypothetical protein OAX78_00330 [Planctomycetota bacterium]|nr:hypothetical protein [Planctomycetota bacterium]
MDDFARYRAERLKKSGRAPSVPDAAPPPQEPADTGMFFGTNLRERAQNRASARYQNEFVEVQRPAERQPTAERQPAAKPRRAPAPPLPARPPSQYADPLPDYDTDSFRRGA